jgi:hypothetical protein
MALELKTQILPTALGASLAFKDITGATSSTAYSQGGNIGYANVTAIRLKTSTYLSMLNPSTVSSGSSFTQYKEYQLTGTACTVNNKSFSTGAYFVPQSAGIAVVSTWVETGFYVYPHIWLPTATEVALDVSIAELNEEGTTVLDAIRELQYEVYYSQQTPTIAAISGITYLVSGTGAVLYASNRYNVGEVFTAYNTANITVYSGSPKVNTLYAATNQYFASLYNVNQNLYEVIVNAFSSTSISQEDILEIRLMLEAINNMASTNNISLIKAQDLLTFAQDKVFFLQQ